MKKQLALAAALALCLTACGKAEPDALPTSLPQTQEAAEAAAGSREVHMLHAYEDGIYYRFFQQCEIDHTDQIGRQLIYAIDEATGTARPACNIPNCPHDSDACPAWSNNYEVFADGEELYVIDLVNDPDDYHYTLCKINADRTQHITLVENLPRGFVQFSNAAADDSYFYWTDCQNTDNARMDQIVYAISKTDGSMQEIYRWHDLPGGPQPGGATDEISYYSLAGAQGSKLYWCRQSDTDPDNYFYTKTTFGVLDLTDGSYADLTTYEAEGRQEYATASDRSLVTFDHCYYSLSNNFSNGEGYLADCNYKDGEAAVIDLLTGERTLLATNLPHNQQGWEIDYSFSRFGDAWLLRVYQWERDENGYGNGQEITDVYYCADGTSTPLPQKRYCTARGTQPINLLDCQNGIVLATYDYWIGTVPAMDKDGTSYIQDLTWDLYGTLPLADLLAGSNDFTPLQFCE